MGDVDDIEAKLAEAGSPERAAAEQRYLKSDLRFLGTPVGEIRRIVRAFLAGRSPGHDGLVGLATELWSAPVHERRMAALLLLALRHRQLDVDDLALLERLARASRTWALLDLLATDVIGPILERQPDRTRPILDRWAADPDFWVRRASLLAELRPLRAGAELAPFLARAEAMLDEHEFFIRKAIGWVLREVGKRRPDAVAAWLGPRTHRASGVTMREAVRYLAPPEAARLMTAYREKRPA